MRVPQCHFVKNTPLVPPFPENLETAIFGKGCFWGGEQQFWELDGVYTTATGYAGGNLEHPTYADVCAGDTGHAEVVLVVYDPAIVTYERLLRRFWKGHRPIRKKDLFVRARDQYRSIIFTTTEDQILAALASRDRHQNRLPDNVRITTEIAPAPKFYYAEAKHQQYSAKQRHRARGSSRRCSIPWGRLRAE